MTFDEFVERKDAERAEAARGRVTWRRVAFDPEHRLASEWAGADAERNRVYVRRDVATDGRFYYGRRIGVERVVCGDTGTLSTAKLAAERLLRSAS